MPEVRYGSIPKGVGIVMWRAEVFVNDGTNTSLLAVSQNSDKFYVPFAVELYVFGFGVEVVIGHGWKIGFVSFQARRRTLLVGV